MTRSVTIRTLALLPLLLATTRCTETTAPRAPDNSIGVIASGLVHARLGTVAASSPAVTTMQVVYVSLPPAAVPAGQSATITNGTTGLEVTTAVVNGGFDPVPIGANAGDVLTVVVTTPSDLVRAALAVAARRQPRVVRTNPPTGGRDVPLNAAIVVIFSEPIDSATLDTAALQLFHDAVRVPGTVQLAGGANLLGVFRPASPLAPQTSYQLTISSQIAGVSGMIVTAPSPVAFTTGTTVQTQAAVQLAFTVQPTDGTAGVPLAPVSVAFEDSLGHIVTSDSDVVTVGNACVPQSGCDSLYGRFGAMHFNGVVAVKAVRGVATFSGLQEIAAATGYVLMATSGTLPPVRSAPFNLVAGAQSYLLISGTHNVSVGQAFSADVTIDDIYGNRLPTATDTVTLSLKGGSGSATLSGTLTASAVNGVAHFTNLSVDQPGLYSLVATSGTMNSVGGVFEVYAPSALVSVSAGRTHTCGTTIAGVAFCWGLNDHGQLGDGTTTNATSPVPVGGGLAFASVSAGANYSCGVTLAGDGYCWGANTNGQLGDGTTSDHATPQLVTGGLHFSTVSAGVSHTCGLVPDSSQYGVAEPLTYCWGSNDRGQLGDGTTTPRTSPTAVATVAGFGVAPLQLDRISLGDGFTCGINADAGVDVCWGANGNGQLDDGTTTDRATPVLINLVPCGSGPPGFTSPVGCPDGATTPFDHLTTGAAHTCAAAGGSYYLSLALYCWGSNSNGQLGDGTTTDRHSWTLVNAGQQFSSASAGGHHTCAVAAAQPLQAGAAYCWGLNANGQLGDGTVSQRTGPVLVAGGLTFVALSAGDSHTCGVTFTGVYCWGGNAAGQLGNGNTTDSNVPVKVSGQ